VVVMAGVSLVTAVPLLLFFAQYPYFFVFRIAYVANKGKGAVEGRAWLTWLLNIGRTVRGLFWLGETHLRHNLPGRPYLDWGQAVTFTTGVIVTVRRKLQPRAVFLLLWLIVMLLPTIMSGDAPHFGRMTGVAPVIAILIGVGMYYVSRIMCQVSRLIDDRLQMAFYVLLIGLSTFFTTRDYFGRYAAHPQIETDFYLADWNLGQYAAAQSPDTSLFLTPTQEEMATIYFALAGDVNRMGSFAGTGLLIPLGPPQTPTLYLIRPSQTNRLADLLQVLPDLIIGEERDNYIPALLPADAPRPQPQYPVTHSWNDLSGKGQIYLLGWSEDENEQELIVTLFWQAGAEMARDYTAFVHLLGVDGQPIAQLDRPPDGYPTSDWQPGEVIIDQYVIQLPADLPVGAYHLQTGFYYLPTLERLGTAVPLGVINR
jgi:hypothetical protein